MFRRWSGSIGSLLLWTCLTACPSSDSGNTGGAPAAGSGGDTAADPDGGTLYEGDAGSAAGSGGSHSSNGGAGGHNSDSWNPAKDVKPAECRPDPTDFTPCGGDVTGKWRMASICFPSSLEELEELLMCSSLEQDFSYDYRMLVEFKSSGSYSAALKSEAEQKVIVPKSCLSEDSDCSELGEDDTDASDGDTITITSSVDSCSMEAHIYQVQSVAGTWEVDGSQLTMSDADGPDTSVFCITDNTLIVKSVNEITGAVSWGVFERI